MKQIPIPKYTCKLCKDTGIFVQGFYCGCSIADTLKAYHKTINKAAAEAIRLKATLKPLDGDIINRAIERILMSELDLTKAECGDWENGPLGDVLALFTSLESDK